MTPPDAPLLDRRSFLTLAGAGIGTAVLAACAPSGPGTSPTTAPSPSPASTRPAGAGGTLRVPALLTGAPGPDGPVFDLAAQVGRTELVPGTSTETWGFDGPVLGPTLRVSRGDRVRMRIRNDLAETTTVHWHGMHLPAAADGGPHQPIEPGETWDVSWQVDQPAATLWYHPHPHGATERHVYRGLTGLLIVDDEDEAALGLPREYGVDDIPLIVQDKELDDTGALVETERRGPGMLGSTVLVNGVADASLELAARSTRLRILNGSTARSYAFGLSDGRPVDLVASDGGLLPEPVRTPRVQLTPGERAEIVVHVEPGESLVLRSFPQDLGDVAGTTGGEDELDVLALSAPAGLPASAPVPSRLVEVPRYDLAEAVRTRRFEMRTDRINEQPMDMSRIDEVVTVDELEVWEVLNTTRTPHNFHVHDVQFQVADLGGEQPPPHLAGWKDTVYLPPGVPVRLALRFTEHTDPDLPYMYHCHLLWHEDIGMMGQFVVVGPEERVGS
ncbi:multicopper oxidase domain-containing protein [Isoptericola sp. AK164]|uniref:multicopper oxidase family protein n=1 Tax=Isoptericola sp. AK164 TaxID=3024246 RepID=UPI002418612F|nr:multicopper oxidase domain-containing protein [Isoptericola sp. AK164]